jgi:hypothetical protein
MLGTLQRMSGDDVLRLSQGKDRYRSLLEVWSLGVTHGRVPASHAKDSGLIPSSTKNKKSLISWSL